MRLSILAMCSNASIVAAAVLPSSEAPLPGSLRLVDADRRGISISQLHRDHAYAASDLDTGNGGVEQKVGIRFLAEHSRSEPTALGS